MSGGGGESQRCERYDRSVVPVTHHTCIQVQMKENVLNRQKLVTSLFILLKNARSVPTFV